jgi:hypothetical protein
MNTIGILLAVMALCVVITTYSLAVIAYEMGRIRRSLAEPTLPENFALDVLSDPNSLKWKEFPR